MRKLIMITAGAVMALLLMIAGPQQAYASGSVDASSSMKAFCVEADCTTVQFDLNVWHHSADILGVEFLRWLIPDDAGFDFTGYSQWDVVEASEGDWKVSSTDGEFKLSAAGGPATVPAWFKLNMSGLTNSDQLEGVVTYDGTAFDANEAQYSFGGTVVPEPGSMILLGSGLLGLGVARRRRRNAETGLDTDLENI